MVHSVWSQLFQTNLKDPYQKIFCLDWKFILDLETFHHKVQLVDILQLLIISHNSFSFFSNYAKTLKCADK